MVMDEFFATTGAMRAGTVQLAPRIASEERSTWKVTSVAVGQTDVAALISP
jgi:hypothetical protein